MKKNNFDKIVDRRNSNSAKWDVKNNELPMWVADMDFPVLPEIKKAIIDRANIDAYGYVECPNEYFLAYQSWWKRNHDLDIKRSSMIYCTGVVAAIDSIFKHLLPKGSNVVIQTPVYHVFFNCIRNNGLNVLENQLVYRNHNYEIDFDNLEELLKQENTRALLLCNPHNPVGRIWTENELQRIVDLCNKYNVLIISDEIHCDIVEPGEKYHPILSITDSAISLLAPTKTFNMAGIQAACIVCPNQQLKDRIESGVGQDDVGEPNYFSCPATIAAFKYGDEWVKEMNEYVYNNKRYMQDFISSNLPELHLTDNKATYLLWLDVSRYTNDSESFSKDLREKTGLFVSPGKQFGRGGESFLRINVATSLDNVKDACERLKKYVKTL